jgi:hypothetical protein
MQFRLEITHAMTQRASDSVHHQLRRMFCSWIIDSAATNAKDMTCRKNPTDVLPTRFFVRVAASLGSFETAASPYEIIFGA